jgi:hypothetical protein
MLTLVGLVRTVILRFVPSKNCLMMKMTMTMHSPVMSSSPMTELAALRFRFDTSSIPFLWFGNKFWEYGVGDLRIQIMEFLVGFRVVFGGFCPFSKVLGSFWGPLA